MAADAYRTPAPGAPEPAGAPPLIQPPHIELLPDGSRVLRKCKPPGWWDRWGNFGDGDVWECPVCSSEFRFVNGWVLHCWVAGYRPPPPEQTKGKPRVKRSTP